MQPYDFRQTERLSPEGSRVLGPMLSTAARLAANIFSGWLGQPTECGVLGVAETTYHQLLEAKEDDRVTVVFRCAEGRPDGLMTLPRGYLDELIERLMGGSATPGATRPRGLTEFDRAMAMKVASKLLDAVSSVLEGRLVIDGTMQRAESDVRRLPRTQAPTERYVAMGFRVGAAEMRAALPLSLLAPIMRAPTDARAPAPDTAVERCARVPLLVSAEFGHRDVTLQQLLALRPGSTILLDPKAAHTVLIHVEGEPKFTGRAARRGDRVMVEITRALREDDHDAELLARI